VNRPIVQVRKELYVKQPGPRRVPWVNTYYVGGGLEREEVHFTMPENDTPRETMRRRSLDNGRTWSKFEPYPQIVNEVDGTRVDWWPGASFYDPVAKVDLGLWLHSVYLRSPGKENEEVDHLFYQISRDHQKTWSPPKMLRYEPGDALDLRDPLKKSSLMPNRAYLGNNTIRLSNGTVVHCAVTVNIPYPEPSGKTSTLPLGSLCFIGKWDVEAGDYRWVAGDRISVPLQVSSRGLLEAEVAELKDHRVVVCWRGSDTPQTAGHKWFSVSTDGGRTLSPVRELKYDDGSAFYSPSSFHRMIRSGATGKLYWIGNISSVPPKDNSPRYPLVIAEVDETKVALKRNTVTLIEDRLPGESEKVELSNFAVLEDRETRAVEIYMNNFGYDPKEMYTGDVYKYTLRFR
jgi:hypothetical protein